MVIGHSPPTTLCYEYPLINSFLVTNWILHLAKSFLNWSILSVGLTCWALFDVLLLILSISINQNPFLWHFQLTVVFVSQSVNQQCQLRIWIILGFNIGLCNLGFFTVPQTPCLSNGICISCYTKWNVQLQQLYSRMARHSTRSGWPITNNPAPSSASPKNKNKKSKTKTRKQK